jgi:hypothetical protein
MVLNEPVDLICKPLVTIKLLLRAGAMPRFQARWGKPPGGDCHQVAADWIADIAGAGEYGWIYCWAKCDRISDHSWLECSGWAFDPSNGCRRGVIVMRSAIYRELRGVSSIA